MSRRVREMTRADVSAVQAVERAAGERFRDDDDPRVASCADAPVFTSDELIPFVELGRAWVATERDIVVGFIVVDVVDGCAHVDEVAVTPTAGRRGHGASLLDVACRWAAREDLPAVTLTTFRDVPWNGPWYTKLGFRELAEREWTPGIRAIRDEEQKKGLPGELRVVMRREVAGASPIRHDASVPSLDDLPEIVISDSEADTDAAELREAVHAFNFDATGYRDGRVLACILRNRDGRLVAGIDGFTWGGYARIDYFWVHEALRGQGLGTRLLAAAEDEARRRGCLKVVLDTHSFQAPGLYRALGYREVGTARDVPVGFSETHFEKTL
jgi:ribosomal protein S18 acetylase RimI-like enzyme